MKRKMWTRMVTVIILLLFPFVFGSCSKNNPSKLSCAQISSTSSGKTAEVASKQLLVIEEYISAGTKTEGIVNVIDPAPYTLKLTYSDQRTETINLYLYDEEENSSFINQADTHQLYRVNASQTEKMKSLIAELFGD